MTPEKLVRDRIPEIIRAHGGSAQVRTITSHEERVHLLMEKLFEEAKEFRESPTADELSDILEVLDALMESLGIERAAVDARKAAKAVERGGFARGLVLHLPGGPRR